MRLLSAGADTALAASPLARALEQARAWVDPARAEEGAVLAAVLQALDAEVTRWEERGREDPDARAVLRAFLTVREVLWELGVRPPPEGRPSSSSGGAPPAPETPEAPREAPARRARRVPVEG